MLQAIICNPDGSTVVIVDGVEMPSAVAVLNGAEAAAVAAAQYVAPAVQVPAAVTMRQARLALLAAGLLQPVSDAIAAMPGPAGDAARIEWEFSSTVERNRPFVQQIAAGLGLTEQQLDDLFTVAATL